MGRRKRGRQLYKAEVPESRLRRLFQRDPAFQDEEERALNVLSNLPALAVASQEYERYRQKAIGSATAKVNLAPIQLYTEWCARHGKKMRPSQLARWTVRWLQQRCPACAANVKNTSMGYGLFRGLCERCAPILAP
jgi:hypothetical protein